MSNDSESLIGHCYNCGKRPTEISNNVCKKCKPIDPSEVELSDKMQAKTIDLTKANKKATK